MTNNPNVETNKKLLEQIEAEQKKLSEKVEKFLALPIEELQKRPLKDWKWLGKSLALLGVSITEQINKYPVLAARVKEHKEYLASLTSGYDSTSKTPVQQKKADKFLGKQGLSLDDKNIPKGDEKLKKEIDNILRQQRNFKR